MAKWYLWTVNTNVIWSFKFHLISNNLKSLLSPFKSWYLLPFTAVWLISVDIGAREYRDNIHTDVLTLENKTTSNIIQSRFASTDIDFSLGSKYVWYPENRLEQYFDKIYKFRGGR